MITKSDNNTKPIVKYTVLYSKSNGGFNIKEDDQTIYQTDSTASAYQVYRTKSGQTISLKEFVSLVKIGK